MINFIQHTINSLKKKMDVFIICHDQDIIRTIEQEKGFFFALLYVSVCRQPSHRQNRALKQSHCLQKAKTQH